KLCDAVMKAAGKEPLDPEALREAVGPAARSLGEAGKKKGLTTTLPLALGKLQASGDLRRVSTNGRLDQQRYRYVAWRPNPLTKPTYALVSSLDAISALRRDASALLDPRDAGEPFFADSRGTAAFADLPSHAILDRGRLVGLWEYDVATEAIAWRAFGVKDK